MNDQQLIEAFETATIPDGEFHHRDHVRLAWAYLERYPTAEVLRHFSEGLRRFAKAKGVEGLYHETITWAYVLLIQERRQRPGGTGSWETFAEHNPDLLDWESSILRRYYSRELLDSERARGTFVFPDRLPEPATGQVSELRAVG